MNQSDQHINDTSQVSVSDLATFVKKGIKYLKTKWLLISIISIVGGILGVCYSMFKKPTYLAVCTFVLEDASSGSMGGQYAGLASLAGINLAGGTKDGVFEGDNILELYQSRSMIKATLLTPIDINGKKQLLIERYIDFNHLRNAQDKDNRLNHIKFDGNPDSLNREQDSVITDMANIINDKILSVTKPDKKLSIIRVEVTTKDELFSKYFTEQLVQTVNNFYVRTQTKKESQNIQLLQHQADSVKLILNASLGQVASANDAVPNANPQMSLLRVSSQKKQVEVQSSSAIYTVISQNLEMAKISFLQETPLIQIIDAPVFPLLRKHVGRTKGAVIGIILGMIFITGILSVKKILGRVK